MIRPCTCVKANAWPALFKISFLFLSFHGLVTIFPAVVRCFRIIIVNLAFPSCRSIDGQLYLEGHQQQSPCFSHVSTYNSRSICNSAVNDIGNYNSRIRTFQFCESSSVMQLEECRHEID